MPDKNTEQLLREQADAVLKVQEEAINTQMKMMESLYGNNPEMLAMMKAQMQQASDQTRSHCSSPDCCISSCRCRTKWWSIRSSGADSNTAEQCSVHGC